MVTSRQREVASLKNELTSRNPAARTNASLRLQQLQQPKIQRAEQNVTLSSTKKTSSGTQPETTKTVKVDDSFLNRFLGRGQFKDTKTVGKVKKLKKSPFVELTPQQRKTDLKNALVGGGIAAAALTPIPDELVAVPFLGRVLNIGQFTVRGGVGGFLAGETLEGSTKFIADKEVRKVLREQPKVVKAVTKQARKDVASEFPGIPVPGLFSSDKGKIKSVQVGTFLESLPIVNLIPSVGRPEVFESSVRKQAKSRGLKGKELENFVTAAKKQRGASNIGEVGEFIFGAEVAAELAGSKFLKEAGTKAIKKAPFTTVFKEITQAGVVESVGSDLTNVLRGQQEFNPKKTAVQTAVASPFAGLLGGAVGSAAVKNKGVRKFFFQNFGRALDFPGEPIGDIVGGAFSNIHVVVPVPSVEINSISVGTPSNLQTKRATGNIKPSRPSGRTPTALETIVQDLNPYSETPTKRSRGGGSSVSVNVPSAVNVFNPVNLPVPPNTPSTPSEPTNPIVEPIFPVSTPTPIATPVSTPINVPTNLPTLTNIPVVVPVGLIPPLLPSLNAPRSGRGGGFFRPGKEFVNELQFGGKALDNLVNFNLPGSTPKPRKRTKSKTKSKSKSKSKKKKRNQGLDVFELLFG